MARLEGSIKRALDNHDRLRLRNQRENEDV
jgi:hypothetical protein